MQIETTMNYHFILIRMAIITKYGNKKCWRGCGAKGTLLHCWWECELIQPLWRTVWGFLKILKIELPYVPEIPLLGIYPGKKKNKQTIIQKKHEPQCSLQHYLQYPGHVLCAVLNHFSHIWLSATLWTIAHQAPLPWGFSRQEHWSGFPCPPPGDLPDPGIDPVSYISCIGR